MPRDPLTSARLLLGHAKSQITQTNALARSFFDAKPYSYRVRRDPMYPGKVLHSIGLTAELPAQISLVAADALKNMRSALDHIGFAVARASGKSGKAAHFPFGDSAVEVQSRQKGACKDIPPEIFAAMVSFMPHKAGNVALWALNKLTNANKHETLLMPVLAAENMIYEADGMRLETGYRETENGEIPVCWLDEGKPNPTQKLQVEVSIRFNDVDGVRLPTDAIRLLDTMSKVSNQIADRVQNEARALGIF